MDSTEEYKLFSRGDFVNKIDNLLLQQIDLKKIVLVLEKEVLSANIEMRKYKKLYRDLLDEQELDSDYDKFGEKINERECRE